MARGGQLAFALGILSIAASAGAGRAEEASKAAAPPAAQVANATPIDASTARATAAQAAAPTARTVGPPVEVGASIFVTGNPMAQACEHAANYGDTAKQGVDSCTLLLAMPTLTDHDRAATYVDRGGIYLQHKRYPEAQADFDEALKILPDLANAYVNRGSALIGQKRYAEGIADIDKGVALNADQPEKAYYNRAVANEAMGDRKAAYVDYQKALALHPGWAAAQVEVVRLNEIAAAHGER